VKKYSSENPVFSDSVDILETTDTNHAGNFNAGTKELFENTLVNQQGIQSMEETSDAANAKFSEQIEEAMKSVQNVDGEVSSLQDSMLQMAMALSAISDADVIDSNNILIETFRDENDIMITSGAYDSEKFCLYA
jgi:hypothetical protein